ncbi:MAG: Gfo/Idh/MocA family oxidoreductase [Gammaproteobacteria bacterium]|nr:Gfo/Idh/MocA family oxidoreductase [Gammaproteobacteria bacterium]
MIRFGILSSAKIAREHLIPAAFKSDAVQISAIASRDLARAQEVAAKYRISQAFGSYEALLESDTVDAVYIPLPSSDHVEWAIKAADAGKHVLVEKPLALNADEIQSVIEARDRNGVVVTEAFMVTYHPQWQLVKDWISDGKIGRLRQVQGAFSYFNRDPSNMRNQLSLGGGALPDIGVYPTVTTRFVTGQEPLAVRGRVDFDPEFGTDIYANVNAEFADFNLDFYVATQMATHQSMRFHGDKGYVELSAPFNSNIYDIAKVTYFNHTHGESEVRQFLSVDQYALQYDAFAHALNSGDHSALFSLEQSVLNQRLLDGVYASNTADGAVITL